MDIHVYTTFSCLCVQIVVWCPYHCLEYSVDDTSGVGLQFDGIGGISGGGVRICGINGGGVRIGGISGGGVRIGDF